MFAAIAPRYDLLNRLLSCGSDRRWRRALAEALPSLGPQERVLDLATGTGDVALEIASRHPRTAVHGCDFCEDMVALAPAKVRGPGPAFLVGDALALPFPGERFRAVTIAFGLRNVQDPPAALREIARVLAPGGRLLILEFSRPEKGLFAAAYEAYTLHVLPRIGRLLSGSPVDAYGYLPASIRAWPEPPALAALLERSGLRVLRQRPFLRGAVVLHVAERPAR